MNNINSIIQNNYKNDVQSQNGGEIKGERLENFRKKYGFFTKTSNIIKEELKKLGKTRKIEKTRKSDFCMYLDTKNLPYKFLFKNLNSSTGNEFSNEFTQYLKLLDKPNDTIIIAMPLFIRFTAGLATNIIFYNITKDSENEYTVNVERFNTYDEIAITEIDDIIDRYLNIELSITDIDFNITVKHYKFDTNTFDIDIDDDIIKSLIYSLFFMYKRFENPDDKTLETTINKITANSSRKDIIEFATKLNILKDLKIEEEDLEESVDKDIIKKLLERPDLKTKGLLSSIENIFDEMENVYEEFDENAINIEELTEKIEYATKQIIEIYEDKKIFYNDLKITRKNLNTDIDNIYTELNKLKDAIVYGVENLILHRGIISAQLQKFEKLSENSNIYENKKEVFENIKKNLENMVIKQNEYDNKILLLKEQLETKKNEIEEKNKQLTETNKEISTAEDGLKILKKKLTFYTQNGGDFITNIINKTKKQNSSKILKHNQNLLLQIKKKFGGKNKSIPEKLNTKLNELIDNNNSKKKKNKISEIIDDITPIVIQYQENIEKYHDTLTNRNTLKKSLQEAFIKLRNLQDVFSETKYKLTDQKNSLNEQIDKIDTIIIQMQNDNKPKDLIDKIKLHKKNLVDFLNTKGNYIQKVEKLNDILIKRKKNLNNSKNDVRNKLNELRNIGSNLDTIKNELETHTEIYGGNILNKSIINAKIKKDTYLEYLVNPIQFLIKGGKNELNIKNYWIKDETKYIFKNFEFNELKDIAKKWGISNINKFENKNDLADALKLILCVKTGLIQDRQNTVVVSSLLDIDISDINKTDIGEIIRRINNKTTNIPQFSCNKNQQGGAGQVIDEHRFREKFTTNKIAPKIVFHIPITLESFIEKNENKYPQIIEKLKLARIHSISHIKNTQLHKSYDARLLKLVDIDDNFAKQFISNSWIEGQYLNDSPYVKDNNSPFSSNNYKEMNKEQTVHFIENAIDSHNSAIAVGTDNILATIAVGTDNILANILEKKSTINFSKLLQQHVNQLVNINSPYLTNFMTAINQKHPNITVFKPIQSSDNFISTVISKHKDRPNLKIFMGQFGIKEHNTDYKINNPNRIIIEEKLHAGTVFTTKEEEKKAKYDLITGELIGYKTDGKFTYFIIYNIFHHMNPKKINIYNATLLSHTTNQTNNYIQSGGNKYYDSTNQEIITNITIPGEIQISRTSEGIIQPNIIKKTNNSTTKESMINNEIYMSRDPKSKDLMNSNELSEHLRRIGKIMLHLNQNGDLVKQKTKIGIFNVIGDKKKPIININGLFSYLKAVESWGRIYKPDKELLELNSIISYIKQFYKGNQWNAVIKSEKMKALDSIKKLQQLNENTSDFGDYNIQIPGLKTRIDDFISNFKKDLVEYEKKYLKDYIDTKDVHIFLKTSSKKSKSYLLKQYSQNIKNIFYKKDDKNETKFNFYEFPINQDGIKHIEDFIKYIERLTIKALEIETNIILVSTVIDQLSTILHIITTNNKATINNRLRKRIIIDRNYATKLNTSTTPTTTHANDLTEIINKLQTGGLNKTTLLIPDNSDKTTLLIPKNSDKTTLLIPTPIQKKTPDETIAVLTPPDETIAVLTPDIPDETIAVLIPIHFDIISAIKKAIVNFETKRNEFIKNYTDLGSKNDNDSDSDNTNNDNSLSEFIELYLENLDIPINYGYKFKGKQFLPNKQVTKIWNNLKDQLEHFSSNTMVRTLIGTLKNEINVMKPFLQPDELTNKKIVGEQNGGDGGDNDEKFNMKEFSQTELNNIIYILQHNIESQNRTELLNLQNETFNKLNSSKEEITSTTDRRHKILSLLAQIDYISQKDGNKSLKEINILQKIFRNQLEPPTEVTITELVYNIILNNNIKVKLPAYYLIYERLQFVKMLGFVNAFEKMWQNDTSFHGEYKVYINKLIDGTIFGNEGKSSHYDIGDINNIKFLRTYYSDFREYINKNNISTFNQFLSKTYSIIFPSGEVPKGEYDKFWNETKFDIKKEWDKLRTDDDFNGLEPSTELFGKEGNIINSFERGLLFSLIIHAKASIDILDGVEPTPIHKFNRFRNLFKDEVKDDDIQSYIIISLDTLNNKHTGGGFVKKMKKTMKNIKPYTYIKNKIIYDAKHDIPGRFYFNKSLDNITYLYIYKNECEEKKIIDNKQNSKKIKSHILNPKDKLLIKKLHFPESNMKFENENSIGIKESGKLESIMVPATDNELSKCAEYRFANTGKNFENYTIWEFEKKDFKDEFHPIILWPKSELSLLEKDIIGVTIKKTKFGIQTNKSRLEQKELQNKKYKALKYLIEIGDFGDYYENIKDLDNKSKKKILKTSTRIH